MLNLINDIPIKTNLFDSLQNIFAQIRDLLLEAEQQMAFMKTSGDYFLTKKKLQNISDVNHLKFHTPFLAYEEEMTCYLRSPT